MKRPSRGSGSRRSHLSEDDEAVWKSAASTVEPLQRKSRVHPSVDAEKIPARPFRAADPPRHGRAKVDAVVSPPASTQVGTPPLADFDKRHARKLRSGRVEIERRVDLHGMTQREAHAVLRRFLFECHAQGRRSVLVITGKGAPGRRRRQEDDLGGWSEPEPGVLKRRVPQWLAEPELRTVVVSYTTAAVQHGGEGALYVHLRRVKD